MLIANVEDTSFSPNVDSKSKLQVLLFCKVQ